MSSYHYKRERVNTPSLADSLKLLDDRPKIPWSTKAEAAAGRTFRRLWIQKQIAEHRSLTPVPQRLPRAISGGCIFAAAVGRRIFGGDIQANWHHVWLSFDHRIIDLTGLSSVPLERAVREHAQMLRDRGYTVRLRPDGTYQVILDIPGQIISQPSIDPPTFFEHDPKHLEESEYEEMLASVVPPSHSMERPDHQRHFLQTLNKQKSTSNRKIPCTIQSNCEKGDPAGPPGSKIPKVAVATP